MTNTEKLTQYMRFSNVTIEMLAKRLNVSKRILFKKMNNITELKVHEINIICDYLKIPLSERSAIFFDLEGKNELYW